MLLCYYVFKKLLCLAAKLRKDMGTCKLSRHYLAVRSKKESNRFPLLFKKIPNTNVKSLRYGMQAP